MKYIIAAVGMAFLAGCCFVGNSPYYITYALDKKYDGHPMNQFVADYGYPAAMYEKTNGTRVYRWASSSDGARPRQAAPTDYAFPGGVYQSVDTYNGTPDRHYCEIRIYTDSLDTIKGFALAVDSTGKFSTSQCSEIFTNPLKP